ncbi:DUF4249 family protein [Paraflavitalea speifideaquila]|uniref:DUF4249 family protein n=1 Tax=Paraflavitalea speifideaquila TaxID=3076558 RepID=UPI0028E9B3F9|nr:DUF4249 family protein [Paraflavitalea speifideiaquila]
MRIPYFIACTTFIIALAGCTKDFNPGPQAVRSFYTIEGSISTMKGPYHVRITKSTGLINKPGPTYNGPDNAEPVKGARVIITDDAGTTDTLTPAPKSIERYKYVYHINTRVIDTLLTTSHNLFKNYDNGFYQTTKIKGQPGHTYRLRVEIGHEVFEASAFMPPVSAVEHAEFRDTILQPYTNRGSVPYVFFKDPPNEKNYYLLTSLYSLASPADFFAGVVPLYYAYDNYLDSGRITNTSVNTIQFYVFDDRLLSPGINIIPVRYKMFNNKGEELNYSYGILQPYPVQVRLQSLTKEIYNYLNILIKQLEDDGNIYKPAPSSAPGNISGERWDSFMLPLFPTD